MNKKKISEIFKRLEDKFSRDYKIELNYINNYTLLIAVLLLERYTEYVIIVVDGLNTDRGEEDIFIKEVRIWQL